MCAHFPTHFVHGFSHFKRFFVLPDLLELHGRSLTPLDMEERDARFYVTITNSLYFVYLIEVFSIIG